MSYQAYQQGPPQGPPQGYPQQGGYPQQPYGQQQPQQPQQPYGQQQPHPAMAGTALSSAGDHGSFPGGSYSITHRDTNAILNVDLAQGAVIKSAPGAMVHMSATVQLSGKLKFSMKKLFAGGEMHESSYSGPGRVALGPTLAGDIVTLQVDPSTRWKVGKDAFLACTPDVKRETKSQGFGKALFSGEDLFIYHVVGQGIIWLTSFGAVDRIDLQPGQQHIVDNGHLVAWSCDYSIERAGGGTFTSMKTGEGLVCRFTGPGSIYIQTRNMEAFADYVKGLTAGGGNAF